MTSPISRLSPEILAAVFFELTDYENALVNGWQRAYQWVLVTEVCRFWRDVALSCPNLWTYLAPFELEAMRRIIFLSKFSSLKLDFPDAHYEGPDNGHEAKYNTFELLSTIVTRLRDVLIIATEPDDLGARLIKEVVRRVCPRLRSLTLNHSPGFMQLESKRSALGAKLALQCLALNNCSIPWAPSVYSRLTSLSITTTGPWPRRQARVPMSELLHTLGHCIALETLELQGAGYMATGEEFPDITPIILPRLFRLQISMPVYRYMTFLHHVHMPPLAIWAVITHGDAHTSHVSHTFLRAYFPRLKEIHSRCLWNFGIETWVSSFIVNIILPCNPTGPSSTTSRVDYLQKVAISSSSTLSR